MQTFILKSHQGGDFKPHPEGIHQAVCVDVIDLGMVETEFQGQRKFVHKVQLVFETESIDEDGKHCTVWKNFTASLHPKAKLSAFLGKWRGHPVMPGENIDLNKLKGASCTLVISHAQNMKGKLYASIDAVSKPTRKVMPSGTYDPAATRQRIEAWKARAAAAAPGQPQAAQVAGSWLDDASSSKVAAEPKPEVTPSIPAAEDDDIPW